MIVTEWDGPSGLCRKTSDLQAGLQPQQHFAVDPQFRRHDVEQVRIDSQDGYDRTLLVDIAQDAERYTAELINPKQQQPAVLRR